MFNLSFYYHSFLYWEKVTSDKKYNHKWKLYGKFQRFDAINRSIKMLKNGWISKKFQLEWKKTFSEGQTASRVKEII